jgi:hypothetical protein
LNFDGENKYWSFVSGALVKSQNCLPKLSQVPKWIQVASTVGFNSFPLWGCWGVTSQYDTVTHPNPAPLLTKGIFGAFSAHFWGKKEFFAPTFPPHHLPKM